MSYFGSKPIVPFVFEGLGSLAAGYYANYAFFLLRDQFGVGNTGNLLVAAAQGAVFAASSWQGGRFAQRHGSQKSLKLGLAGMIFSLLASSLATTLASTLACLLTWTASSCFIWPALESLVSEQAAPEDLPRTLGVYNAVWAACSALSYFAGGFVFDRLGRSSIFWLPISIFLVMLALLPQMANPRFGDARKISAALPTVPHPRGRLFLHLAWLANPFACIGINTVVALAPGLAKDLQLTATVAGWFCSVWFFGRLAAFLMLARWNGWHYRFRWLMAGFAGLIGGFAALLLTRSTVWLVGAQAIFGLSVGLLYYSSLFYSMDVGDAKSEHGGVHEAAMGAGNCLGPAAGATALLMTPSHPYAGVAAVSALLLAGFGIMLLTWFRGRTDGDRMPAGISRTTPLDSYTHPE